MFHIGDNDIKEFKILYYYKKNLKKVFFFFFMLSGSVKTKNVFCFKDKDASIS